MTRRRIILALAATAATIAARAIRSAAGRDWIDPNEEEE